MDALYCLRDMLHTELENVVNSSQGNIPLDIVDKITHSLKSVETIIAMKEGNEYKNNNYANNNYNSYSNGSYGNQSYGGYMPASYANAGRNYNNRYNNYRMGRSYGNGKEEMMNELHEMMNEAKSEQEKQAFQQFINQMQNM